VIVGSFATSRPVKSSQVLEPAQHVENRWSLVGAAVDALGNELLEGRVAVRTLGAQVLLPLLGSSCVRMDITPNSEHSASLRFRCGLASIDGSALLVPVGCMIVSSLDMVFVYDVAQLCDVYFVLLFVVHLCLKLACAISHRSLVKLSPKRPGLRRRKARGVILEVVEEFIERIGVVVIREPLARDASSFQSADSVVDIWETRTLNERSQVCGRRRGRGWNGRGKRRGRRCGLVLFTRNVVVASTRQHLLLLHVAHAPADELGLKALVEVEVFHNEYAWLVTHV
jgi:hypothetical protein